MGYFEVLNAQQKASRFWGCCSRKNNTVRSLPGAGLPVHFDVVREFEG